MIAGLVLYGGHSMGVPGLPTHSVGPGTTRIGAHNRGVGEEAKQKGVLFLASNITREGENIDKFQK